MSTKHSSICILFVLLSILSKGDSWGWYSSSSSSSQPTGESSYSKTNLNLDVAVARFSIDSPNDQKTMKRLEEARRKMGGSNPCWLRAYGNLFSSCSEIFAEEERRRRLAWDLSVCFQRDSGRPPFPSCGEKASMIDCLQKLNNDEHKIYLEFYLETNSICHQLQSKAFSIHVENLVNELKDSAQFAEDKLESIEEKSSHLVRSSDKLHESLTSIDLQTTQVSDTLRNMVDHVNTILTHSKELQEQAQGIAVSQAELLDGQEKTREKLDEDMAKVKDSYNELGREIDGLQAKSGEIEKEISRYGEAMFSRMERLQGKADDIDNKAVHSLDKQQELLDGQTKAFEGLQSMTKYQSQALEESRLALQGLQELAQGQHEKLLNQQDQLLKAHEHLAEKSRSILAAQETFESKQANMLMALDRLFALQKALLLESRLIKTCFVYIIIIFLAYMFTGAKQTHTVRFKLYIGLSVSFLLEFTSLRLISFDGAQQSRLINAIRLSYVFFSGAQLLYSYFTYRDYEAMNHEMLVKLMDKVNGIVRKEDELCYGEDDDSDVDWSSWVDEDLPEHVDYVEDPDFAMPENLILTIPEKTRYNLRRR
ncbi:hypothetical protein V2J09_012482 [Rumex salicifolius]